ncbi:uncharacterized protein LOC129145663 [Talpa occidentalis]|uniref:uncharacterized protein LOC129145663 n=1 Tax=Talpa occidentalis TaxID=50954 RepID=UPI0023FA05F7|nr:uncharacterized protein LOC129145663 [Talpa occidentalis]
MNALRVKETSTAPAGGGSSGRAAALPLHHALRRALAAYLPRGAAFSHPGRLPPRPSWLWVQAPRLLAHRPVQDDRPASRWTPKAGIRPQRDGTSFQQCPRGEGACGKQTPPWVLGPPNLRGSAGGGGAGSTELPCQESDTEAASRGGHPVQTHWRLLLSGPALSGCAPVRGPREQVALRTVSPQILPGRALGLALSYFRSGSGACGKEGSSGPFQPQDRGGRGPGSALALSARPEASCTVPAAVVAGEGAGPGWQVPSGRRVL